MYINNTSINTYKHRRSRIVAFISEIAVVSALKLSTLYSNALVPALASIMNPHCLFVSALFFVADI